MSKINLAQKFINNTAFKVDWALNHPEIPEQTKDAIKAIIFDASNEANFSVSDHILENFPVIMGDLELEYGRGIIHSLNSIIETLPGHLDDEFNKKFEAFQKQNEESEKLADNVVLLKKPKTAQDLPKEPVFDQLTPAGVEMLKNMGDIETAKLYLDDLVMDSGGSLTNVGFLIAFLDAIDNKIDAYLHSTSREHPGDFIGQLQRHLFNLTIEYSNSFDAYLDALKSGNFVVEKLIVPKSENEPELERTPLKAVA